MNSSLSIKTTIHIPVKLPGNGDGFVQPDWQPMFNQVGLHRAEDFYSVTGEVLSKPGLGKRYRAKLQLSCAGKACLVFLKRYEGETLRNLSLRWFEDGERSAIALREVKVAQALEKIHITTFRPLAWGSQGNWGTRQKSFVVMSRVSGESIECWLPQQNFGSTTDGWRRKIRLVQQVAGFSKRIHENGWFHRDFYLCHIFISETDGNFQFALVDLARMFRPRWQTGRWRIKDLAQLNYSALPKYFSRSMRLRFAQFYFGVDRLAASHKKLIRRILKKTKAIERHDCSRTP